MKKVLAVFAALAMAGTSALAFAGDIAVSGSVDIRSRDFQTLSLDKNDSSKNIVDTQERVRLNVNAKSDSDNVKAKLTIENDWDTWGRFESPMANGSNATTNTSSSKKAGFLDLREAWVSFNVPDVPVNVTAGHQMLALGNAWFLRSMKYGTDGWVVANVTGNNTAAVADGKVSEGSSAKAGDDVDFYALLDVLKLSDAATVGINISDVNFRGGVGGNNLYNVGLHGTVMAGPVKILAEADLQAGKNSGTDAKYKGNQIVVQGTMPIDPVTLNFTLARGTGHKSGSADHDEFMNFMDADQHYTFLFEYQIAPAGSAAHGGFSNVTALNIGASSAVSKSVTVGADVWLLQATEKVNDSNADGTEIDVKLNWKMYDSLAWNWQAGYFAPGKAMENANGKKDGAMGIQGVLSYNF